MSVYTTRMAHPLAITVLCQMIAPRLVPNKAARLLIQWNTDTMEMPVIACKVATIFLSCKHKYIGLKIQKQFKRQRYYNH